MFDILKYIAPVFILSTVAWHTKSIRFYIMSFFFDWLNEHEEIGKYLGVKYENDYELVFNRKESIIYTPGIYKLLTEWFVGININLDFSIYKKLIQTQFEMSKKINLNYYIDQLKGRTLNIDQFEDYIAESFLTEISKELNLKDSDYYKLKTQNKLIRIILNSLTGETENLLYKLLINIRNLIELRQILLSLPPDVRLFTIVPQFTILNKFIELIVYKNGNLQDLQFYEFVMPGTFLTMLNKNDLYIVRRFIDKTNNYTNIGFGVKGFQCPASRFVFMVITNIMNNLKKINIRIEETPVYSNSKRFKKIITNKRDILLHFNGQ